MKYRIVMILVSGFCACTLTLNSCKKNSTTKTVEGTRNQILYLGTGDEPKDLDPHTVNGVLEFKLISALLEGLVTEDPKTLLPVPGIAETWTISPDQLVYTFKLRPKVLWSDGTPCKAEDFAYSFQRILMPKLSSEYAYMLHVIKNAKQFNEGNITDFNEVGVKALDDHTLQITLESPIPYFLSLITHHSYYPVQKATIEKFGAIDQALTRWTRPENYVGNGPFKLASWEVKKIIVVQANPLYWDAANVRMKEIHFYPVSDQITEEKMFREGLLHWTSNIPIEKIAEYRQTRPEVLHITPYLRTYFYQLNVTKKPLNDKRVRKALAMAINREQIVENCTKGGELPAYFYTPPNTLGYTSKTKIEQNKETAQKLLAEAGYKNGVGFPQIEILFNADEANKMVAQEIQKMWKENLNISVKFQSQDRNVYQSNMRSLNYHICGAGWSGDYYDPNTFLNMFVKNSGNNMTGWYNKRYDSLISAASFITDITQRYVAFQKAEAILLDEIPIIPIYIFSRKNLILKDVKGWYPNILDHHPWKYFYLEQTQQQK